VVLRATFRRAGLRAVLFLRATFRRAGFRAVLFLAVFFRAVLFLAVVLFAAGRFAVFRLAVVRRAVVRFAAERFAGARFVLRRAELLRALRRAGGISFLLLVDSRQTWTFYFIRRTAKQGVTTKKMQARFFSARGLKEACRRTSTKIRGRRCRFVRPERVPTVSYRTVSSPFAGRNRKRCIPGTLCETSGYL
jgi:hypothetical protein